MRRDKEHVYFHENWWSISGIHYETRYISKKGTRFPLVISMGPQIRIWNNFGGAQARANIRPYSSSTVLKLNATHQRRRRVRRRPVHRRERPPWIGFRHDAVHGATLILLGNPHSLVCAMGTGQFQGSVSFNCIRFGRVQYRCEEKSPDIGTNFLFLR